MDVMFTNPRNGYRHRDFHPKPRCSTGDPSLGVSRSDTGWPIIQFAPELILGIVLNGGRPLRAAHSFSRSFLGLAPQASC